MPKTARIANAYAYAREDLLVDEHPIHQELSQDKAGRRRK
jgi:hypothetical protein